MASRPSDAGVFLGILGISTNSYGEEQVSDLPKKVTGLPLGLGSWCHRRTITGGGWPYGRRPLPQAGTGWGVGQVATGAATLRLPSEGVSRICRTILTSF